MPSDSNGVHSLPSGYLAITGETIQASQHNPPLEDLSAAMTQRLMRTGAAPMLGPLKAVDGTAGAPGLTFASATSSGLYKTSNGIGVTVNGSKVAEFGAGGIAKGILPIGLGPLPWSRLTAPAGWLLCYGQTLNRADYPDLWAVAQDEIAAGNAFYNNGNGSTTFGIGDMRGCVVAARDNMGGTAAGRLSAFFEGADSKILGARSGSQSVTLTTSQMPAHGHAFSGSTSVGGGHTHSFGKAYGSNDASGVGPTPEGGSSYSTNYAGDHVHSFSGVTSNNGSGQAHGNVQPTMVTNFILFAGA